MADRAALDFEMRFGHAGKARKSGKIPNIVVLGDFGHGNPGRNINNSRRERISVDAIDKLIGRLRPRIDIAITEPVPVQAMLDFRTLDDFHPDTLYESVPVFQELAGIRQALANPSTERTALERLSRIVRRVLASGTPMSAELPTEAAIESASDVVKRLFGGTNRPGQRAPARAAKAVDQLIRSALGDANIERKTVAADVAIKEVTSLLTVTMRGILTHADFQEVETCWRGIDWLVRRVEDDDAQIEIVDAPWLELEEALSDSANLENTFLTRMLCDVEDNCRPDLIVGLYTVKRNIKDLSLLATLGAIASRAGAVFATHGSLALIGCASTEDLDTPNNWSLPNDDATLFWHEVRSHPVARNIVLLAPRFVLRYPYGQHTNAIDAFDFEELPTNPSHEAFCWGNPALLFALSSISGCATIDDLPMPIYDNGLGQAQQPSVELFVSERVASLAAERGLQLLCADRKSGNIACDFARCSIEVKSS